jgi:hypothetical protein
MTSERDIMYGVSADYFGAAARLFTLQVKGSDLFDDSRMVMEAERSMEKNQGQFLMLIVKYVMEHGKDATIRKIHSEYQKIAVELKGEDNIVQRWGRYFAVLKVTAGILKEVTELDLDADSVIEFMVGVLRERLQEQRSECTDTLLEEELYVELLSHAEENRYIVNGECIRYITSKAYKGVIQKFICNNHLNYTYREISHKLCDMELIRKASVEKADKNVYGLGKCYLLKVREEELAVEAAECRLDEKMAA